MHLGSLAYILDAISATKNGRETDMTIWIRLLMPINNIYILYASFYLLPCICTNLVYPIPYSMTVGYKKQTKREKFLKLTMLRSRSAVCTKQPHWRCLRKRERERERANEREWECEGPRESKCALCRRAALCWRLRQRLPSSTFVARVYFSLSVLALSLTFARAYAGRDNRKLSPAAG